MVADIKSERLELSMRQLRHLLRLHHDGVSAREIGRRLGVARSTIQDSLKRAAAAGLVWPLAEGVTDDVLEQRLFGRAGVATGQRRRVEPDWAALARELKRPGVTMMILWEEYREVQPGGYGYSRFCDLLRGFERRLTPVMRQHHVAGDKAFVDYSGKRIGIADPSTGEIREAEIFVGVLGASNLTYAEATWTQQLADWTGAHKICGIRTPGRGEMEAMGGAFYAVQVPLLNDLDPEELAGGPIQYVDGRHDRFDRAPADTRFL
jgi:hypothetical protein